MNLSTRLEKARKSREVQPPPSITLPDRADRAAQDAAADPYAELKQAVHSSVVKTLGPQLYDATLSDEELARRVRIELHDVLERDGTPLAVTEKARLAQEIADNVLGYGPLEQYLVDPNVTEIMVNGPHTIYVERQGKLFRTDGSFTDESHLRRTIEKIVGRVGRRIDESSPMVDARLPDGSRVNAVISPLAVDGSVLTVRKFAPDPFGIEDLVSFGTLTTEVANMLRACVRGRVSLLVSGGTGAGKTTTLNVLSSFIPEEERIITIEDAAELQLDQEHVVRMESRPPNIEGKGEITIRDLVRNALRMRPDRIVVGEVRDAAALDMLQAMNTGHDGSICTVHANSPRDALARIETMVLMAGVELPSRAIREQTASAIDLVVHQARMRDGSRRVTHITEVVGMEGEVVTTQDLFMLSPGPDGDYRLMPTGLVPRFAESLSTSGNPVDPGTFAAPMATGAVTTRSRPR